MRETNKQFYSKALEVNLSETKQDPVVLTLDQKWFLSISEKYWGIHKYTQEFFNEYHHKYANYEYLSTELRKIALGDFWLYAGCEDPTRATKIISDVIFELIKKPLSTTILQQLIQILVDFTTNLVKNNSIHNCLAIKSIDTINNLIETNKHEVLLNSGYIRQNWILMSKTKDLNAIYTDFLKKISLKNLDFWASTLNIDDWLESSKHILSENSQALLLPWGNKIFAEYRKKIEGAITVPELSESIPLYSDFANHYRKLADEISVLEDRFQYLVFLLNVSGMSHLSHFLLVDLNVVLKNIFDEMDDEKLSPFLETVFKLFNEIKDNNPSTVLDCLQTIGTKLANKENTKLLRQFQHNCIKLGFIRPGGQYITSEWRMHVNPYHLKNIRVWLEIIEAAPEKYQILLGGLIANLKLGGIFIFDTDLFQKDVSKLLNSDIKSTLKLTKQLCRIFPVYFNEIGAEGDLRDVTTQMDEISHRQDRLIHFLRKQIHIESNNTHIDLTVSIFKFWVDRDIDKLRPYLPDDVFLAIEPDGQYVKNIHEMISEIAQKQCIEPDKLIYEDPELVVKWIDECNDYPETEKLRLKLICRLYFILEEKYSFNSVDICKYLRRFSFLVNTDIDQLEELLKNDKTEHAVKLVYKIMEQLNDIILSDKKTEGWENIYYKRHVAFGIPSMYGEYHERRFEALGLIFKLEHVAATLMEDLSRDLNMHFITANSLQRISKILELYRQGIKLDGISIKGFDLNLKMFSFSLQSQSFSLQQHMNLFRFMSESIREIISQYFFRPYDEPLKEIVPEIFDCSEMDENRKTHFIHQKSEEFYRDLLSSAFLLQNLDNFVAEISDAMHNMADNNPPETIRDIMTFNTDMIISPFNAKTPLIDNQVFLGSKAYFLKTLSLLGFPVPPGFVITTEVFRRMKAISQHEALTKEIDDLIMKQVRNLERQTGKKYGNKNNPLLLSVRSGTAISMPGAMNTFLNVGINAEIADGLCKKDNFGWTSWDCYRRFLQTWGMSNGMERDVFDQIMIDFKNKYGVQQKLYFKPEQMREMAFAYKIAIEQHGIYIEEDPIKQLKATILNVFNSWSSPNAIIYRKILQIADEWGTAVIVQNMVLGNLNYTSGTGVLFTHAPHISKPGIFLFGDYSLVSQGEDIVGGLVNPRAVSVKQPNNDDYDHSLQVLFPEIYQKLYSLSKNMIEDHGFSHQEIEFTFESQDPEDLYILQTRDQDIHQKTKLIAFEESISDELIIGRGIGIGDGVMNGIVVFNSEDIRWMKAKRPDQKLILIRPDTVPEDIGLIYESNGLITARGGATSHAAVTAVRLGKICVVNTANLVVNDKEKHCTLGNQKLFVGDLIAIDGNVGCIYKGNFPLTVFE